MSSGAVGPGRLPRTLSETLAGQIATLPDESQRLLAVVALAGRPVDERLVAAVSERDEAAVREPIRAAVTAGILVPDPATGSLRPRHALIGRGPRAAPAARRASWPARTLRRRALDDTRARRSEPGRGRRGARPSLAGRRPARGGVPCLHLGGRGRGGGPRVRGGVPPVRDGDRPRAAAVGRGPRRAGPAGPRRAPSTCGIGRRRCRRQQPGDRLAARCPRARR